MSDKVLISRTTMENIANAIREASGTDAQYLPAQMPQAIRALGGGMSASVIAPPFSPAEQYEAGDLVIYGNVLFKFTEAHSGNWLGTDVIPTTIDEELSEKQNELITVPVTLTAGGWQNNTQTVTVSGILADETKQLIQPVPSAASREAYLEANVMATAQGANSLTFTCDTVPSANLSVYVVITPLAG